MDSQLLFSLVLFSSWVFLGFSQSSGGASDPTACITKLLPCQDSIKSPAAPPASCCVPLKQMINDDPQCLCGIYNDPSFLKNLNITQTDLLSLPKGCGVKVDMSVCKTAPGASSPTASSVPATSNGTSTSSNSTSSNSTSSPTSKNSADGISPFSGLGFIATFVTLILSAF
ncbi:non-specific lipid transfer protein GPI-anchored 3-like [Macadamia integrifolia]|uniref:non-specific lipid transfer protein GPI-anchored 3-like n=1 Tax=Macadamia integrifolia TaxID=60698 RepID=UPI001C4F6B32|nr:non-specific lipid transfer protein GPI-anchored 3-like [Macadamia integrifolia]